MDARSASSVITFVILFFALATGSSEGTRRAGKFYWANGIAVASSPEIEIDEDMAEELWIKCRLDLVQMKESDKNIDLNFPEQIAIGSNGINSEVQSLENGNLQKAISALPSQTIEILLDCLRKKDHFYISGEEGGSKNWYTKYMEFLFGWPEYSRRFLGGVLLQNVVSPAQAPAVEPPTYGPRPSSAPAPATSYIHPPVEAPKLPFFPRDFSDSSPQPSTSHSSVDPIVAPGTPSRKHNNRKPVVIAVVVTAVGTLVFASMLFFFYLKCYRSRTNTGSGDGQKDDRPLLSLGLSDYSVDYQLSGSSQRYSTHGSSINKDKYGTQLFNTNINQNGRASSLNSNLSVKPDVHNSSPSEAPLSGRITGAAKTPVEPSTSSSNIHATVPSLPLKLPPGRARPAPHLPPIPSELQPSPPPIVPSNPPPPPSGPPRPPPSIPSGLRPPPPVPSGPPPPPPIPSGPRPQPPVRSGLRPPSPISSGPPPPPPPIPSARPRPPLPPGPPPPKNVFFPTPGNAVNEGTSLKAHAEAPKAKLKPFFWDKVLANPDHSMVWHQISSGSFQFNEEMIETLFGYAAADKNKNERKKESLSQDPSSQYVQLIDSKKSQNLSILLRALNVTTEEVCDALQEGNELPIELLEALLKMAPTAEEELKLRLFNGELSQLGPAERFLKVLVDIPFSFKRFDCLLFMGSLQEEASVIKESLATLEVRPSMFELKIFLIRDPTLLHQQMVSEQGY
ncbi:PREDICTED: formin-like protein 5 [Nelumbo nucifera]|uniref:Formin-like protein 5 n=1 Tax=Nelumbo nucifera TaxID=4432 RepID=A0A1U8PZP5_NELNU|nr:PREDICTED: formin-like protein 5 [Nelumbo nucifera]